MKRYVLLVLIAFSILTSCSIENDDSNDFYLEVLPIESVEIPEQFVQGETYEILVSYNKPSSCYQFNDFIYNIDEHERTVAVVNTVYSDPNCIQEEEVVTVGFDFMVSGTDTYLFKFYQGEDEDGIDQYYLVEVPVVNNRSSGGKL